VQIAPGKHVTARQKKHAVARHQAFAECALRHKRRLLRGKREREESWGTRRRRGLRDLIKLILEALILLPVCFRLFIGLEQLVARHIGIAATAKVVKTWRPVVKT
jgi:hypothetical protein